MTALDDLRASGGVSRLAEFLLPNGHPEQGGTVWRSGGTDGDTGRSLTCAIDGEQSGTYYDHASGDSGSLIQLLMEQERIDTVSEARAWLVEHGYIGRNIGGHTPAPATSTEGATALAAPDDADIPSNKIRTCLLYTSPSPRDS